MEQTITHIEHRDDEASKMGMWIFIFTELLLFGGLFLVYAVFRAKYSHDFHVAAMELNAFIGTANTVILLISSMTVAMSITAVQKGDYKRTIQLLIITILLAAFFGFNKYIEWSTKFHHGLWPGSDVMLHLTHGQLLFFGLYFATTGLHALHVLVGMTVLTIMLIRVKKGKITKDNYVHLENGGLYWHLVDIIWIFLFPLLYLVT